jgi:Hemerythrin HHE cation binding domain
MTHKIEELAAKAVGAAKAVVATARGYEGVFRHLVQEHGEASALLLRLQLANDPDKRRELWPKVRNELLSHEQAERSEVYPTLRQEAETRTLAEEHERDASGLQEAVEELNAVAFNSAEWQPSLERLIALVKEHVREEEEEQFPIADRVFQDRTHDMLQRFEEAKSRALRQLGSAP